MAHLLKVGSPYAEILEASPRRERDSGSAFTRSTARLNQFVLESEAKTSV
jgi:hypothetical protein